MPETSEQTTRRGNYRPPPPEEQSEISRAVVVLEITVMLIVLVAVAWRVWRAASTEQPPVKIAAFHSSGVFSGPIPAGVETGHAVGPDGADADKGQALYTQSCMSCHGQNLQGMPHQGVPLRENKFIKSLNDPKLVAFLKNGRKPADPGNTTGLLMPPRGGNPSLDDDGLKHIVAYLRLAQKPAASVAQAPSTRPLATIDPSNP